MIGIMTLLLMAAKELVELGKHYEGENPIHHVVQKKYALAEPARKVLRKVHIDIHENDSTAQLRAAAAAGAPNLIEIKPLTHRAIHSALVNFTYTLWVNSLVCGTPLGRGEVIDYIMVATTLTGIKAAIRAVDVLL